jgi:vacuolar-type H+-ATPase subunit I/STV1
MVEVLLSVLGGERQKLEEARSALRDREIDNLQRRIHKLNESLETTERRLKEVAAMKSIDEGVASIYRDVQGLAEGDSQRERKKELMSGIFAANLRLQKKDPAP